MLKSGKEGGTKNNVGASLNQNGTRHRMHLQRNHQPTRPLVSTSLSYSLLLSLTLSLLVKPVVEEATVFFFFFSTYVQCCALHGGDEMTQTVKCFLTAAGLSRAVLPRDASLMSAYDPRPAGRQSSSMK